MASSLQQELDQKYQTLQNEWNAVSNGNDYEQITAFFDKEKQNILSHGTAWFFENLIKQDDIESMKHILKQIEPKFINLQPSPIMCACEHSTFAMVRLVVSNGATVPEEDKDRTEHGLLCKLMLNNTKMTPDAVYLCIEYLLRNLGDQLHFTHTVEVLAKEDMSFDRVKIANLIKSHRSDFKDKLCNHYELCNAAAYRHFDFADYMVDNGTPLDFANVLFVKKWFNDPDLAIIQWLSKHNVDINGHLASYWLSGHDTATKITPLFQCCIDKNYDTMELLLNHGADFNKSCVYENKQTTPLQYCERTFPNKMFEYFINYKRATTLLDIDLSAVPNTAYEPTCVWSNNEDTLLNELKEKHSNTFQEISDLETELTAKYMKLRGLFAQQKDMANQKANIENWNNAKNSWTSFLEKWEMWDADCFVQYLKRIKYVDQSYVAYYSSDNSCKQKIEDYMKINFVDFDEKENGGGNPNAFFKGTHLLKFDRLSIHGIGITVKKDINSVYESIQTLTKANDNDGSELVNDDGISAIQPIVNWLVNVVQLPQYVDTFVDNCIILEVVKDIDRDILKELGVNAIGHQMKIINYAKKLNQNDNVREMEFNEEGSTDTAYI
eukprot:500446_1